MRRAVILIAIAAAACTPGPGTGESRSRPEIRLVDEDVSLLGTAIYESDLVSARATDLAKPNIAKNAGVRGWVTTKTSDGWTVDFWAPGADGPESKYRVQFSGGHLTPRHAAVEPPAPLDADSIAMVRAVETAKKARFPSCDRRYNHAVLPASMIGRDGWLVYLLAAHQRHGEVVIGGHARIHVSADGTRILETYPLSKGCLVMPFEPGPAPNAIVTSTLISDRPLETHVYLSLLHKLPVFVSAGGKLWKIDAAVRGTGR